MTVSSAIRQPKTDQDWAEIRRICCLTGNDGSPIAEDRWPLFGEIWIGPYQKLLPSWTYLVCENETVLGYLTGCPDTRGFEKSKLTQWRPSLALKWIAHRFNWSAYGRKLIARELKLSKSPPEYFSYDIRRLIHRDYPAHLHINLKKEARGRGIGQKLVERFKADLKLRSPNCHGIHVYCGAGPLDFYRQIGFEEIARIQLRPGVFVFALGIAL